MVMARKKLIFTGGIVFFVIVLLVFLMIFLTLRINARKELIYGSKKQMAFYDERISNSKEIEKTLERSRDNYNKLQNVFLNEGSLVVFIKEMESFARQSGVELDIRSVSLSKKEGSLPVFTIFLDGPFSSLCKYLYLLENTKYQLAFQRLNLQKDEKEGWGANLVFTFLSFIPNEGI